MFVFNVKRFLRDTMWMLVIFLIGLGILVIAGDISTPIMIVGMVLLIGGGISLFFCLWLFSGLMFGVAATGFKSSFPCEEELEEEEEE